VRDGHVAVAMASKILGVGCFASSDCGAAHGSFYTSDAQNFFPDNCANSRFAR
jgi:hypothetical protein